MGTALKEGRLYYSIKEVAEHFDLNQSTLRFWEKEFPQLHPGKNQGGRRKYTPKDVDLIGRIVYLVRKRGYTLSGAQEILEAGGESSENVKVEISQKLETIKGFLLELKEKL